MKTINILGFPPSTYTQTTLLCCKELHLNYTLIPLEFRSESHGKMHPFYKMPILKHDDFILYESLAITVYLNELSTQNGPSDYANLLPTNAQLRSIMFQWCSVAIDYLYRNGVLSALSENLDHSLLRKHLDVLNNQLNKTPYFAGANISLADLFVAPILVFLQKNVDTNYIEDYQALSAWLNAMKERNGYAEVLGDE